MKSFKIRSTTGSQASVGALERSSGGFLAAPIQPLTRRESPSFWHIRGQSEPQEFDLLVPPKLGLARSGSAPWAPPRAAGPRAARRSARWPWRRRAGSSTPPGATSSPRRPCWTSTALFLKAVALRIKNDFTGNNQHIQMQQLQSNIRKF